MWNRVKLELRRTLPTGNNCGKANFEKFQIVHSLSMKVSLKDNTKWHELYIPKRTREGAEN